MSRTKHLPGPNGITARIPENFNWRVALIIGALTVGGLYWLAAGPSALAQEVLAGVVPTGMLVALMVWLGYRFPCGEATPQPGSQQGSSQVIGSGTVLESSAFRSHGRATGHLGEVLQVWARHNGEVKLIVSSLPCPRLFVNAELILDPKTDYVKVIPPDRLYAREACLQALRKHGYTGGASLTLESNMTVGRGEGSSTADSAASVLAAYHALGELSDVPDLLRILKTIDSGVDSSAVSPNACLVASRRFELIEDLAVPLPHLVGVALDTEPDKRVNTGALYLDPPSDPFQIAKGNLLLKAWRHAVLSRDLTLLGKVMSASAHIGQEYLRNPLLDRVVQINSKTRGLGVFRAHTGTLAGIVFDPHDRNVQEQLQTACTLLKALGAGEPFIFSTRDDQEIHSAQEEAHAFAA